MKVLRSRRSFLILLGLGLAVAIVIGVYVAVPNATILEVTIVSTETQEPLPGTVVQLQAQNGQHLATVSTDDRGIARFPDLAPSACILRAQIVDYVVVKSGVAVPEGKTTRATLPLIPSPGGRLFVGMESAQVAEVDTASLLLVRTLRIPSPARGPVRQLRVHPDANRLYAVIGSQVYILDSQTGEVAGQIDAEGNIGSVDLSADGQHLLLLTAPGSGLAQNLSVTHLLSADAYTGELLAVTKLLTTSLVPPVMWQPDGTDIYMLAANDSLKRLDAQARQTLRLDAIPTGAPKYHLRAVLSPDGQVLYTWGWGGSLATVWTGTSQVVFLSLPATPAALAVLPNTHQVVMLSDTLDTLSVIDVTGQTSPVVIGVGRQPVALTISHDGTWAYVADQGSRTVSAVYLPSGKVANTTPLPGAPYSVTVR